MRFTLPESVWESRKSFFNAYTFSHAEKAQRHYRLFDEELYSRAEFPGLFAASRSKLPALFGELAIGNHSLLTGAVLALRPGPPEKILSGETTVEIRTRFSKRWEGKRVSLYATKPIGGLAGEASVRRVIEGSPDRIWEHFGSLARCTRSEYLAYVGRHESVSAIVLSDVLAFTDPVPLTQLSALLGFRLIPPRSYLALENPDWLTAVALAAALRARSGCQRAWQPGAIQHPRLGLAGYGTGVVLRLCPQSAVMPRSDSVARSAPCTAIPAP